MCGIAGIVATRDVPHLPTLLNGLSRTLLHRGPDDVGFLTWGGDGFSIGRQSEALAPGRVALMHRRLSIVDLSERGWQPMVDATGRYAIVLNGEIYNYPELRKELEVAGVRFRSQTDTEVLLNLLIRSGMDGLRRAVGMFAFAFLDANRRRLWLARDPFGIKPLFFANPRGTIVFSSEIRPLLEMNCAPRLVEPTALFDYLRHAVTDHAETTLISGVRQLPPAHTIEIHIDTAVAGQAQRYWAPRQTPRRFDSVASAAQELRALFDESVRLHLRADVPVAATLSGGIDSSAIVGTIDKLQGAASLAVFSYIADDPLIGEERYVDALAGSVGVHPRKIHVTAEQLSQQLDSLILTQEQPFITTSIWAQRSVFGRVHEDGFKVVMDGQGADELFAGYPFFRAARATALIRRGSWVQALIALRSGAESSGVPLLQAVGLLLPPGIRESARWLVNRPTMPPWLNASWFAGRGAPAAHRPFSGGDATSDLSAQLYDATVATSLPMLLKYADRNAMAVSLENRVPFLTTALADFALSLPDEMLIGADGTTKTLLRTAMRGIVPDAILDRKDKIGFVTPEARWFAESASLRGQLGAALEPPLPPCFASGLRDRLRAVVGGRAPYGAEVWRCWNAIRWAQLLKLEFEA